MRGVRPRWQYNRRTKQWHQSMVSAPRKGGVDLGTILIALMFLGMGALVLLLYPWS